MAAINEIRNAFPYFSQGPGARGYVYLDNAATTQKPQEVLNAMNDYYIHNCANIHRGVHQLSQSASHLYETARTSIANFFGAGNPQQIIFTSGATESLNLICQGLSKCHLKAGDTVMLSVLEHHSNILPWQEWALANNGTLKTLPLNERFEVDWETLEASFKSGIALLSVTAISNTLGVCLPINELIALARRYQVPVCIDASQMAGHQKMHLDQLQPDFMVCSAHKLYGPTGVGLLYMATPWLNRLPVVKTGGGAITSVAWEHTVYADGALRYEDGTPHIAGVIGFAAALQLLDQWLQSDTEQQEQACLQLLEQELCALPEVCVYAPGLKKTGSLSFNLKRHHAYDVGMFLDQYRIAVRTGHHCTQPLMHHMGLSGTLRASVGVYTAPEDIEMLIAALKKTILHLNKYHD